MCIFGYVNTTLASEAFVQQGIAKSGAKVLNSKFVLLSPPKRILL